MTCMGHCVHTLVPLPARVEVLPPGSKVPAGVRPAEDLTEGEPLPALFENR
jgi:hypothetical protein